MVLLNIDTLTTAELRYIAQDEKIDDWDSMERDELLDAINELYDGIEQPSEDGSKSIHKFTNCLTEGQFTKLMNLPGVEALPSEYLETCIHCILKDSSWVYVFWSIAAQTRRECEEKDPGYSIFLRTTGYDENGKVIDSFDINVSEEDKDWSFSLPWLGASYKIEMIADFPMLDSMEILARSETVTTPKGFSEDVLKRLEESSRSKLCLSCMVSKQGDFISNKLVAELFHGIETAAGGKEDE